MEQPKTDICRYNDFTTSAAEAERKGEWDYARKLWEEANKIAARRFWADKAKWTRIRATFCETQHLRGRK